MSRGLLWPPTAVNDTAMIQCSEINPSTFRAGPYATRKCLEYSDVNEGLWDEVDITNCTTRSDLPLVTYATYLVTQINEDITQNITMIENEVTSYDNIFMINNCWICVCSLENNLAMKVLMLWLPCYYVRH